MSDRRTLTIDGDVSQALTALAKLEAAERAVDVAAGKVAESLRKAEAEAARLAEAAHELERGQDGFAEAAKGPAEALEHQARLLGELGGRQSSIIDLQREALQLRMRAANAAGDEAAAVRHMQALELAAARRLTAEKAEAIQAQREHADALEEAIRKAEELDANIKRAAEHTRDATEAAQRYKQIQADLGTGAAKIAEGWDRAASKVKPFGASLIDVASKLGNIATGISSVIDLAQQAFDLADRFATQSAAVQATSQNLQIDIRAARAEVNGLVSDYDLARMANRAYAMDVADTGAEFAEIVKLVRIRAQQLGENQQTLIENYIEAVGKQEAEIFDNLGLTLRLTDAYDIFAESIGKSAKDLTESEKAAAFQAAALEKLREATGQGAAEVEGFANSWQKAKVSYEDFKNAAFGFEDTIGRINEALRELSNEELEKLRFGEMLDNNGSIENRMMFKELTGFLDQWNVSLVDLRGEAQRLGITYQELLDRAIAANDTEAEEKKREEIEAQTLALIEQKRQEAEDIEHINALEAIRLGTKKDSVTQQRLALAREIESLELLREAALLEFEITKEKKAQLKADELARKIELATAKAENVKRKGGSKGSSAADKLKAELNGARKLAAVEIELAELRAEAAGNAQAKEQAFAERRHQLAVEALENERKVLDITKAKNAADRIKNDARRQEIDLELQVLSERKRLEDAARDREASKRESEERIALLTREIELAGALGANTRLLEEQLRRAEEAAVELYGTPEELAQYSHEQELARIEREKAEDIAKAQRKLDAYNRDVELATARGQLIEDEQSRRLAFEAAVAAAEGDTARQREILHQREVAMIQERVRRQQQAVGAVNGFLGQGQAFASLVIDNAIKDDARREKAALRLQGVMALAKGAMETVNAVSAFASFNFIQGALHTAAAAVAYTQGAIMLAGNIPGNASASAATGGGAAGGASFAGPGSSSSSGNTGGGSQDLPPVPPSAEELARVRGGYSGASTSSSAESKGDTVINFSNSTIVSGDTGGMLADLRDRRIKKRYGT